jgi:hypothetical protein
MKQILLWISILVPTTATSVIFERTFELYDVVCFDHGPGRRTPPRSSGGSSLVGDPV